MRNKFSPDQVPNQIFSQGIFMTKSIFVLAVTSILSVGISTSAMADDGECANNFTMEGNLMSGRTYKTFAVVPGVTKADAIAAAGRNLATDGWQINSTNENMGVISASQGVTGGTGKTVPLNVLVDDVAGGVKVSMTYRTSGGLSSPTDAVVKQFCTIIAAVAGN
jgi:hypothetical protein